jgi:hypothetical protein
VSKVAVVALAEVEVALAEATAVVEEEAAVAIKGTAEAEAPAGAVDRTGFAGRFKRFDPSTSNRRFLASSRHLHDVSHPDGAIVYNTPPATVSLGDEVISR